MTWPAVGEHAPGRRPTHPRGHENADVTAAAAAAEAAVDEEAELGKTGNIWYPRSMLLGFPEIPVPNEVKLRVVRLKLATRQIQRSVDYYTVCGVRS